MSQMEPGWYPVQGATDTLRYWDGRSWGKETRSASGQTFAPPATPVVSTGLVVIGWIGAFLLPVLGLGVGIYCAAKGQAVRGIVMVVVSLIMGGFYFVVLTDNGGRSPQPTPTCQWPSNC